MVLAVGFVPDASERQRVHKGRVADPEAQAADWNAGQIAIGSRV